MTYQSYPMPKTALRPVKRVLEPLLKPKLKGLPGGYLKGLKAKVFDWPKL